MPKAPKWKRFDLEDDKPSIGKKVNLRIIRKSSHPMYPMERYDIGCFDRKDNGKLCWVSSFDILDPEILMQKCDIWWCPVIPFDGI